jgi:hypothetical protein
MLKPDVIESLPALAGPVLSVYLDTDQAKKDNRGLKPGYLIRLESQAKTISQAISRDDQELFRKQLQRTEAYLRSKPQRCRGIVIFAGSNAWKVVPLQVDVKDEIRWGRPATAQLLWLLEEHKPYGIVVLGRKRVRFFLYRLGEVRELDEKIFRLEPSKRKEMGPVARPGVRLSRGTNRDVFERHLAAEYAHYYQQIADRIERWCGAEKLESVFLVGLAEMGKAIRKEISSSLAHKIALMEEDLGWVPRAELLERVELAVVEHNRKFEMASIDALLGDSRNAVLGVDEALVQLQQGKIRSVVVTKALNGILQRCINCSWADRTSDSVCSSCGGRRERVELRDELPELVRRYNASLEIVTGDAARKLQQVGGMGARLREFEKKEYSASA